MVSLFEEEQPMEDKRCKGSTLDGTPKGTSHWWIYFCVVKWWLYTALFGLYCGQWLRKTNLITGAYKNSWTWCKQMLITNAHNLCIFVMKKRFLSPYLIWYPCFYYYSFPSLRNRNSKYLQNFFNNMQLFYSMFYTVNLGLCVLFSRSSHKWFRIPKDPITTAPHLFSYATTIPIPALIYSSACHVVHIML